MKVFVAGATGALGRQLVPRLVAAGHDITGMTRSAQRADLVRELGAEPAVADALDPDAVGAAVSTAGPEVIVHELTALSASIDLRHFERDFAQTNRLRTEGTDILLSAARAAGTRRFVAQSYAGWPSERRGGPVKTEDDPFDQHPPAAVRTSLEAIAHLERAVTGAAPIEGLVLRYGGFYGPGTSLQLDPPGGEHVDAIRGRKFPIVGGGGGVWSFVHIEDAAEATAIAVERGAPGRLQRRRRPARGGSRLAAGGGPRARGEAPAAGAAVARPDHGRRGGHGDDDRGPRRVEREGKARARLDAAPSELRRLARGGGLRGLRRERLDQLAELVRRRDRGQHRQRDPAGDELVEARPHLLRAAEDEHLLDQLPGRGSAARWRSLASHASTIGAIASPWPSQR